MPLDAQVGELARNRSAISGQMNAGNLPQAKAPLVAASEPGHIVQIGSPGVGVRNAAGGEFEKNLTRLFVCGCEKARRKPPKLERWL